MERLEVVKIEELNSFADESRANDGGGYSQPLVTFTFKGIEGIFEDSSCGDFGSRYYIEYAGKEAYFGSMVDQAFSDFTEEDQAFLKAFYSTFGVKAFYNILPTREELQAIEDAFSLLPTNDLYFIEDE